MKIPSPTNTPRRRSAAGARGLLALLALCCAASGAAAQAGAAEREARADYERRTRQQKIGVHHIPADLDDAMATLDRVTSEEIKDRYAGQPEDFVVERLYFSFGRWLAVNWGLYDGSRFAVYLRRLGVDRPDGQKEFIMRAYHRHLNGREIDVRQLAESYKRERAAADSLRRAEATVIESFTRPVPDTTRGR